MIDAFKKRFGQGSQGLFGAFKQVYKDDESIFRFATTLKILAIPLFTFFLFVSYMWTFIKLDLTFFEANGYSELAELRSAYFDYLIAATADTIPYIGGFMVVLTFMGMYIADLLMRPFKIIGDYCERVVNGENASYDPDFFTDLKLLTSFSEYFFNYLTNARKNKELIPQEIPKKYTRIHKPVFERSFFLQYSVFLMMTFIAVSVGLFKICTDLNEGIIRLAMKTLEHNKAVEIFLNQQTGILEGILMAVAIGHIILYFMLAVHLYGRVGGPAFGVFATMRSFIKGNYNARVHLVGYYYTRNNCRKLNRFLDLMQRELDPKN